MSWTLQAIKAALAAGYKVDADAGTITGLSGRKLAPKLHPGVTYPRITVPGVGGLPRSEPTLELPRHRAAWTARERRASEVEDGRAQRV